MGVFVPQVVTEDRASGAQVIDGSLKFDSTRSDSLQRTTTRSASNAAASFSVWVKLSDVSTTFRRIITIEGSGGSDFVFTIAFNSNELFVYDSDQTGDNANAAQSGDVLRDPNAWYHIFYARTAGGTDGTIYINGVEKTKQTTNATDIDLFSRRHDIGQRRDNTGHFDGLMSHLYVIDGQRLNPTDFAYTDPLTNTWRPKKYTGTFGTMGYYLPFDGNFPIGQDKSGNGNDFTPVNLGGHVSLDKATGGKPILRTVSGGNWGAAPLTERKTYAVTVVNDGGNKYFLDGVNYTSTTIPLLRGGTYKFDQSDSTNSGHPLRFATAADAAGSTEYTDGVTQSGTPGQAGAFTRITVPHNAPNTLYYYCTNHNGMGGATSNSTDETKTDLYASNLVFAVPLVGNANDVSDQINGGSTAKTITANGNAAASSDKSIFYGGSFEFDGNGDYLETPNNTDFQFGTGDWTIEFWWNGSASGSYTAQATTLVSSAEAGTWRVGTRFAGLNRVYFASSNGSAFTDLSFDVNVNDGNWHHVAVVRSSGTIIPFVDGVDRTADLASGSVSDTQDMTTSNPVKIGYNQRDSAYITGYLSDLRIYKGVAKYTNNFIPASTNPDILPDTPSGTAYSSKLTKITEGAVNFNGTDSSLEFTDDGDMHPDSGDFTLECFLYNRNTSGERHYPIIQKGNTDTNNTFDYRLYFNDTNAGTQHLWFDAECSGTSVNMGSGSFTNMQTNRWYHVAVTRASGTFRVFLNGILQGSDSSTSNAIDNDHTGVEIGFNDLGGAGDTFLDGTISNVRFIKGTALYTTDFTPPTRALTNVTNTKLLCCQSTTSATAAAVAPGSITANGDAAATNFNPFTTDINAVRGQESGYATLNPLNTDNISTFSDGNLSTVCATGSGQGCSSGGNIGVSSGKWYCEMVCTAKTATNALIGICTIDGFDGQRQIDESQNGGSGHGYVMNGTRVPGGTSYGTTWAIGDVMGIALDLDSSQNTVTFYKNGVSQGPINITNARYVFGCSNGQGSSSVTYSVNFGQKPFKFPPPEGFQPLCLANLPRPTEVAVKPDRHFGILTYTGDGATTSGQTVTDTDAVQFTPDLVWIKKRGDGSGASAVREHILIDSVRGKDGSFYWNLSSNDSAAETSSDHVSAIGEGSITVHDITSGTVNQNLNTFVAWCWKAGGTAVSNTDGTITSSVSANTDAGFSMLAIHWQPYMLEPLLVMD